MEYKGNQVLLINSSDVEFFDNSEKIENSIILMKKYYENGDFVGFFNRLNIFAKMINNFDIITMYFDFIEEILYNILSLGKNNSNLHYLWKIASKMLMHDNKNLISSDLQIKICDYLKECIPSFSDECVYIINDLSRIVSNSQFQRNLLLEYFEPELLMDYFILHQNIQVKEALSTLLYRLCVIEQLECFGKFVDFFIINFLNNGLIARTSFLKGLYYLSTNSYESAMSILENEHIQNVENIVSSEYLVCEEFCVYTILLSFELFSKTNEIHFLDISSIPNLCINENDSISSKSMVLLSLIADRKIDIVLDNMFFDDFFSKMKLILQQGICSSKINATKCLILVQKSLNISNIEALILHGIPSMISALLPICQDEDQILILKFIYSLFGYQITEELKALLVNQIIDTIDSDFSENSDVQAYSFIIKSEIERLFGESCENFDSSDFFEENEASLMDIILDKDGEI